MLQGFGFTGFRSFGASPQFLYPLKKVNILVGRNNSGKSNVLRIIKLLEQFVEGRRGFRPNTGLDAHIGTKSAPFSWRFPILTSERDFNDLMAHLIPDENNLNTQRERVVRSIIEELPGLDAKNAWVAVKEPNEWAPDIPNPRSILGAIQNRYPQHNWQDWWYQLWTQVSKSSGGSFDQHHGPLVLDRILRFAIPINVPKVNFLGAHRQIGAPGTTYQDLNGQGLIARLLELQNPELASRKESLEKFERINEFVAQVLEIANAHLEVPHSGKELNVSINDRVLPIESLGTGVHEVIIFAAAATAVDNQIFCIEEPEIHLHPRLQRQLLSYLQKQTNNQYFITTHSACLLDSPDAALFHISLNNAHETEIHFVNLPSNRASIGFDLGYKASDLVQANCVIWVEGPSDRIYINSWIRHIDSNLEEGLHYSIMFYGGRLLSHLTAEDKSVDDFINLQRLNRNVAIVIDSDRRKRTDVINSTKKRVLDEIERTGGFGWVTAGREIENYISGDVMLGSLNQAHGTTTFKKVKNELDCCYEAEGKRNFSADKIAVARLATSGINLDVLDLRKMVGRLVEFIKLANR